MLRLRNGSNANPRQALEDAEANSCMLERTSGYCDRYFGLQWLLICLSREAPEKKGRTLSETPTSAPSDNMLSLSLCVALWAVLHSFQSVECEQNPGRNSFTGTLTVSLLLNCRNVELSGIPQGTGDSHFPHGGAAQQDRGR
jgi:hypothetical protein